MAPREPAPPRPTLLDVLHLAPAAAEIGAALLRPRAGAAAAGADAADVGAARLACTLLRAAVDGSVTRLKLDGDAALLEDAAKAFGARFPRLRALEFAPSPAAADLAFLMLARVFEAPLPALQSLQLVDEQYPNANERDGDGFPARALVAAAAAGRCPALAALDLSYCCDDADVRALLGSEPLTRPLKRLGLQSRALTCATAEALAAAAARGALPALSALRLRGSEEVEGDARLDARALRALATVPRWSALEEVDLSRVDARGDPDGAALAGFLSRAPRLRVLRWEVSKIASADWQIVDEHCLSHRQALALLAEAAAWPRLEALDLAFQEQDFQELAPGAPDVCAALAAAAPRFLALRALRLNFLLIDDGDIAVLTAATWARLESLALRHANLDAAAVGALCAAADRFPALRALSLARNHLEDCPETIAALLAAFGARLVELDLSDSGLDTLSLARICAAALPLLETCLLTDNHFCDAGVRMLARAPPGRLPRLRALDLREQGSPVSDEAIAYFNARAPAAFPALNLETGVRW